MNSRQELSLGSVMENRLNLNQYFQEDIRYPHIYQVMN